DCPSMRMAVARGRARCVLWAGLGLERTYITVARAGTIQKRLAFVHGAARPEPLATRAMINVIGRVISKVAARERAVVPPRLVEHRNVWRDILVDQPVQHRSCPVGGS